MGVQSSDFVAVGLIAAGALSGIGITRGLSTPQESDPAIWLSPHDTDGHVVPFGLEAPRILVGPNVVVPHRPGLGAPAHVHPLPEIHFAPLAPMRDIERIRRLEKIELERANRALDEARARVEAERVRMERLERRHRHERHRRRH